VENKALCYLRDEIGASALVLADAIVGYSTDQSHAASEKALAIAFPRSHEDVLAIVRWANRFKIALVPSGGRTGLSGGATATSGCVIVSLERMQRLLYIDKLNAQIRVEAGMVLETLQNHADSVGLYYPVDYASKGSAQMGGALATNAGGIRVLRYGMTRNWVAGFKAVSGAGESLDINRNVEKDNAGYDLKNLIIGSEGTLAIITEVTLRLAQPMPAQHTALFAFNDFAALVNTFVLLRGKLQLSAAEFFCQNALRSVCHHYAMQQPFENEFAYYLLLECDATDWALDALAALGHVDVIVSQNLQQTKKLWALRELISSSLNPAAPYKNDIACQLSSLLPWMKELQQGFLTIADDLQIAWFGHLGDGNIHINILRPESISVEKFTALHARFDVLVGEVCQQYHASISAEHGIGLLKMPLLHYGRSAVEIALYRSIKQVFDPNAILNPGKLLP
jgi:FAD/FMN-containing dehydrogenase